MSDDTARLAKLIDAKLQVLELVVQLSRKQLAQIEAGQTAELLRLLAAKQTVLHQLQAVERQLDPYRDQDPERRRWPSPAARAACQEQAQRANGLLAEALALETAAESAMLRRRQTATDQLAAAESASAAWAAYAPTTAIPATLQAEG